VGADEESAESARRAKEATRAVVRMAELARIENDEGHGAAARRSELVFEALAQLRELEALGSAIVLPLRARLRRLAFPGVVGDRLARVDLERMARVASHGAKLGLDPRHIDSELGADQVWLDAWLLVGSGLGITAPLGDPAELHGTAVRLHDLAVAWTREILLWKSFARDQALEGERSAADLAAAASEEIDNRLNKVRALPCFQDLALANVDSRLILEAARFKLRDEDRARFKKDYVFQEPHDRGP
jgi:hypothetical protein